MESKGLGSLFWVFVVALAILVLVLIGRGENPAVADIYKPVYLWQDSLALSTSPVDSAFITRWEEVAMWSVGCGLRVRLGAPDTTNWESRDFVRYLEGQVISVGPVPKLYRLEFSAVSGSGTLYMVGLKKVKQH